MYSPAAPYVPDTQTKPVGIGPDTRHGDSAVIDADRQSGELSDNHGAGDGSRLVPGSQPMRNVTVFNSFYVALQTGVSIVTASYLSPKQRALPMLPWGELSDGAGNRMITTVYDGVYH